jgi:hypothetical protein
LQTHGAVDDPNGYATSVLKDTIGYQGTAVAFIQLIAAMDRDGEITRSVRGKRTYRIEATESAAVSAVPASAPRPVTVQNGIAAASVAEIDYDRLARAVVREFFVQAAENATAGSESAAARLRAERDEYALMLEMARLRLSGLLGDRADDKGALLRRLNALSE